MGRLELADEGTLFLDEVGNLPLELQPNFLERAVIVTRGSALYIPVTELEIEEESTGPSIEMSTHEAAERSHILRTLRDVKGMIAGDNGAAARLGLKRTTLNSKIKKLGITRNDYI